MANAHDVGKVNVASSEKFYVQYKSKNQLLHAFSVYYRVKMHLRSLERTEKAGVHFCFFDALQNFHVHQSSMMPAKA